MAPGDPRPDGGIEDSGPAQPWGNDPWPGTTNLKAEFADKQQKHNTDHTHHDNLTFKDGVYWDLGTLNALIKKFQMWRKEFDDNKVEGKTARENLVQAGKVSAGAFGGWKKGESLHANASGAQRLMLQAYDYFIASIDAVIDRMNTTANHLADGEWENVQAAVEQDNVQAVTYSNIVTIDFGKDPKEPQPTQPGQSPPGGQQNAPGGQQAPPGGYS